MSPRRQKLSEEVPLTRAQKAREAKKRRRANMSREEALFDRAKDLVKNHVRLMSLRWPYANESDSLYRLQRGTYECASGPGKCLGGVPDGRPITGPRQVFERDHIVPVVDPALGRTSFVEYFSRSLCGIDGYQLLCKPCHEAKTEAEAQQRQEERRQRKLAGDGTGRS